MSSGVGGRPGLTERQVSGGCSQGVSFSGPLGALASPAGPPSGRGPWTWMGQLIWHENIELKDKYHSFYKLFPGVCIVRMILLTFTANMAVTAQWTAMIRPLLLRMIS